MINQDFSNQNLRGHSFNGQNLEGANFSHADIRGANFTNAYLRGANFSYADIRGANFTDACLQGANFSYAKAGLQKRWVAILTCISWIIAAFSGFFSGVFSYLISALIDRISLVGWFNLIVIIIFTIFITRQGLSRSGVLIVALALVLGQLFAGAVAFIAILPLIIPLAFVFTRTRLSKIFALAVALIGVLAGVFSMRLIQSGSERPLAGLFVVLAIAGAVALVLFSSYIAWRAMNGDEKYSLIFDIAIVFAATGGTNFYNADLTDADFTQATLKSTDLRNATLTRTRFFKTKSLNFVRPDKTYLQNVQLRQLLITGEGNDKNFDRQDLRGVNLQNAILTDASFIAADLSEANLKDANLSGAKLVQSQLNATDFTGATLTGAYIEDWGITNNTKFDGVRCEYVYMRLPTKQNPTPLRKPDNENESFADGDFGDFIKPIFDTLDLYHNQDLDPRAIAISYKQLAKQHPDAELDIVAIEKRGEDKLIIRVKTSDTANKSQLNEEYFDNYDEVKRLPEEAVRLLLLDRDNTIRELKNIITMITTVLEGPNFYSITQIQHVDTMTSNTGSISIGGSVGGNVNNVQGNNNPTVQVTQQNQVQTNDTYEENLAKAQGEVQNLLYQLIKNNQKTNQQAEKAIHDEIKNNSTLKNRLQSALEAGGLEVLKAIFDHPLFSIPAETIKGFLEAE
jgi:uncharacterized protein YjbI with pentapeptide repeats